MRETCVNSLSITSIICLPMLKTLPLKKAKKTNVTPTNETLFAILNYSKSCQSLKILDKKTLLNFN